MLVDDAVVVVEAIYYRIQRGAKAMRAAGEALTRPVSVLLVGVVETGVFPAGSGCGAKKVTSTPGFG